MYLKFSLLPSRLKFSLLELRRWEWGAFDPGAESSILLWITTWLSSSGGLSSVTWNGAPTFYLGSDSAVSVSLSFHCGFSAASVTPTHHFSVRCRSHDGAKSQRNKNWHTPLMTTKGLRTKVNRFWHLEIRVYMVGGRQIVKMTAMSSTRNILQTFAVRLPNGFEV